MFNVRESCEYPPEKEKRWENVDKIELVMVISRGREIMFRTASFHIYPPFGFVTNGRQSISSLASLT
jgi:hypothetical protein